MDPSHTCEKCGKGFSKKSNLQRHRRTQSCFSSGSATQEWKCPQCDKVFNKKFNLDRHLESGACIKQQNVAAQEFKCPQCDKLFYKKLNLERHLESDACNVQQKCPQCDKVFNKKFNLDRHLATGACIKQQNVAAEEFKCPQCDKTFNKKFNLDRHLESGDCIKQQKCPHCDKVFDKKFNLDRHLEKDACNKPKHICPECSSEFKNNRLLTSHIIKSHPKEAFHLLPDNRCSNCLRSFVQEDHLKNHVEKGGCKKRDVLHTCPECGKGYVSKHTMLEHVREKHPKRAAPIKPHRLVDVESYQCCGETFANGREYRTHKDRVHIRKPPDTTTERMTTYVCKECQEKFKTKSELIQHRKEHRPESESDEEDQPRYFKCPYGGCDRRFETREDLSKHKWVHRGPVEVEEDQVENDGECDICGELFWFEEELCSHKKDVHNVEMVSRTYQCPYVHCDFRSTERADLVSHKARNHPPEDEDEENIQCDLCQQWFTTQRMLKRHKMDDHDYDDNPTFGLVNDELEIDADALMDSASAKALYTKVGDDVVDKSGEKKFKTTRTRKAFKLTPNALRLCEQGLALEVLSKIIDSMFKNVVKQGGYIQIKVLSDTLDTPIVMPMIHVKLFDPLVLLNYIESVMSSKDELALDQTLTFDVIHVEDVSGSGRLNLTTLNSYIKRRTGIFDPRNWDHRCLGICLAEWVMIQDKDDFLQSRFYKDPTNSRKLQNLTTRLYAEAGVDPDDVCGDDELKKFQTSFNESYEKQIIVLNDSMEHVFTGQPERQRENQVFLLLFNKHYYLIWDMDAFIGHRKRYCARCVSIYDATKRHHCKDVCPQCERPDCEAMENPDTIILCERCNITFKNLYCYMAHGNETQKVCMTKRYRCKDCLSIRYTDDKQHRCERKPKCPHCFEEVDLALHLCKVQVPAEKTRLGGSPEFNVVYFDAETGRDDEGKLVPYTICYAVNCEKCIDLELENCAQCGTRYKEFWGWQCANEFCDWLTTTKRIEKHRTILTAHNSSKFDAYFIYEYMANVGAKPTLHFKANDLLSFTWKKIQLKDSLQFMKSSLDKLPDMLGLTGVEKGFFAYRLAEREPGLNYRGKIPPAHYFMIEKMSQEKLTEFWAWYTPLDNDPNYIYDLKAEALKYCRMDVKILESAWKVFRKSCLKLTDGEVDPLIGHYFTLASFSASIYKSLFMENEIGIIPYGGYRNPKRTGQSWQGSAYLDFLNHQREANGQEPLVCANNSVGEIAIGPFRVDGYCLTTDEVVEILGCYWHAHCSRPVDCMWENRKMVHPTRKPLTFEDVNIQTLVRLRQIEETGRSVRGIWTCDIVKEMNTNPLLSAFMKDGDMLKRYKRPLEPSQAVFGGRVESFKPRMVLTDEQIMRGYTIEYVDFCSLYPFVQWAFSYTTNPHPSVIVQKGRLNQLVQNPDELKQLLENNYGLCFCTTVPPYRLNYAVLPYRARNKTVFPLCRTCAENDDSEGCDHDGDDRALEGVYTFYELFKAIQRGYSVTHVFEIWDYGPEKAKIMADYVSKMITLKTQHSPVPTHMTPQEFCDLWNDRVPGLELKPEDLSPSPAMRQSAKILMNSLWGKFCERASRTFTCLVDGWSSLKRRMDDKEIIISRIEQISDRSLVLSYQKKQEFIGETSMYNPVLGAYVTAYARMTLLEKCLEVVGDRALYCDTDSLVYLSIPTTPEPVRGEALGQLANELKSNEFINCFQCIAPKTWRAEVSLKTCEAPIFWRPSRTIVKSKGVHLMALGSTIKKTFDNRELWNDLIEMKLVGEDGASPRRSIKEFYDTLEGYQLPQGLVQPCLDAFMQQKWLSDRANKKASGIYVPQPKLVRDRFTGRLKEDQLAKKIVRFRHDKSLLLNCEENWPKNQSSTRPYGFRLF